MVPLCGAGENSGESSVLWNARVCRIPLEGVIVVPLPAPGLWAKTLNRLFGLGDNGVKCRHPPRGIIMELSNFHLHRVNIGWPVWILT